MTALSMFGTRLRSDADDVDKVLRRGVAHGVGNVDGRRAGVDGRFDHLAEEIDFGARGVLGREFDVRRNSPSPASRPPRRGG